MNVHQFRLFRDIVRTDNISRAARMNGVSQSAASQLLRSVERQLGVELFDRSTRPLRLTPAGRLYYEACRDIVRRYEGMESQIGRLRHEIAGTVRVASIYSIGLYEMALYKEEFEKLHWQAEVHLEYVRPEKVYQAVLDDRADLGLVSYPSPRKGLKVIPWRTETMVLVCLPEHPLASRSRIEPRELAGLGFISFDPDLSIRKAIDRFFRDHGLQRRVILEFDNIQMIKEALTIGSGVSILPERTVRQEVLEGRLVAVPIRTKELVRPVGIIHQRRKQFSPAAAWFLKLLQEREKE